MAEQPDPQPEKLTQSLSKSHQRWIVIAAMAVVAVIVLANILGNWFQPGTPPAQRQQQQRAAGTQGAPTEEQIDEKQRVLEQQANQLIEQGKALKNNIRASREARAAGSANEGASLTDEDLQQQARDEQDRFNRERGLYQQQDPVAQQRAQRAAQREEQEYKSLFSDSSIRPSGQQPKFTRAAEEPDQAEPQTAAQTEVPAAPTRPESQIKPAVERKPLDFDPGKQPVYYIPEGTLIEAVLTNRLNNGAAGPVNAMITTNVYADGTRTLLIPRGARVLGEAKKVSEFGEDRLAVAFHRILVPRPGGPSYSIPLDKQPPALAQEGEVGLHGKVNRHALSLFGASMAAGLISGLAQIGSGFTGFGYDPWVQARIGVSRGTEQASDRILQQYLNLYPKATVYEGTRLKVIPLDDVPAPSYQAMSGEQL